MEPNPANLFNTGSSISDTEASASTNRDLKGGDYPGPDKSTQPDIDDTITSIVSDYINTLPDPPTKKHIARIMIKYIMKTANL